MSEGCERWSVVVGFVCCRGSYLLVSIGIVIVCAIAEVLLYYSMTRPEERRKISMFCSVASAISGFL